MARMLTIFTVALLLSGLAFAQSSGNFAAKGDSTKCVIDNADGTLNGQGATVLNTTIKTPNSSQTALVIRPSLVTGLYTKNRVSDEVGSATVWAGVRVRVCFDGKIVAPGTAAAGGDTNCDPGDNDGWIYYDKRWVEVSQNFLNQIDACNNVVDTEECFLQLTQSTLSAHSFDFVIGDVGGGTHTVKAEWTFEDSDGASRDAAACTGPAVVTVTQVKTFQQSGGIDIQ